MAATRQADRWFFYADWESRWRWAQLDPAGNVHGQSAGSYRDRHACVMDAVESGYTAMASRRPAALLPEPFTRLKRRETGARFVC